jgi:hypothetical protein
MPVADARPIDFTLTGTLESDQSIGGWTILPLPGVADVLGTRKPAKVAGTVNGEPFAATILPWGDGVQMIPIKAALRKKIGKEAGAEVTIHLTERFT